MKITTVDVTPVVLPRHVPRGFERVVGDWPLGAVVVQMRTDDGLEGVGLTMTLNLEFLGSLTKMTEELGALLIGGDPNRPERLFGKMIYPANWTGPGGLLNHAAAGLDIAVWDLQGKSVDRPLWQLLGGFRDRAKVYDSGSLVGPDIDALQEAAANAVARGYRAMKMRPGGERHARVKDVVAFTKAIRDAAGYDVELMYDVNQTWTPSRCIQVGRAFEDAGLEIAWIEDPTLMHDVAGQAEVARALDTPICSGEYHYDAPPLLRLLQERAVDYLMVDLLRQGGITQFRKVAGMAEAFGVPVASHIMPEIYAHLIAAIPNGLIVEGMPWTEMLWQGLPELVKGELVLSTRPGHGLALDADVVARYRADRN